MLNTKFTSTDGECIICTAYACMGAQHAWASLERYALGLGFNMPCAVTPPPLQLELACQLPAQWG